jgi:hypothetical protein
VASKSLVKWLKILWENLENKCGESSVALSCVVSFSLVPRGGGVRLPFIGQGESDSHVCRAI